MQYHVTMVENDHPFLFYQMECVDYSMRSLIRLAIIKRSTDVGFPIGSAE